MFSRRLDWHTADNALAALERQRRAAGATLLDLTLSNPTAVGLTSRAAALAAALARPGVAAYRPAPLGPLPAREAIAAEYARLATGGTGGGSNVQDRRSPAARPSRAAHPDLPVPAERIALTASSSESYALLFKLLADPGDAVLVPQPSYPLFDYLARLEGLATRAYRLAFDGEWHVDWSSFDLRGARAVIACSPNNPTGSFLRRGDLDRLSALAAAAGIPLIVDEVFADYAFAPAADAVVTVAAAALPALTFALGGLSKSCGLPQMKLGWIAALGPEPAAREALSRLELVADTYLSVGAPVLRALPELLAIGGTIREDIRARVAANRATLAAATPPGGALTWLPAEAGWSAILRLPAVRSDERWALDLLARDGVLVQPGYFFDLEGLGSTIVVSLLGPPDELAQGLRAIAAAAAG